MRNTKGPWTMSLLGDLIGRAENGEPHHITRCEAIANRADAHLIISGPGMLEIIKEAYEHMQCEGWHGGGEKKWQDIWAKEYGGKVNSYRKRPANK
jgi:hypothetical protein